jgi:hypothetical protein
MPRSFKQRSVQVTAIRLTQVGCGFLLAFFALVVPSLYSAHAQQELLGFEARGSQVVARGIRSQESSISVRELASLTFDPQAAYLVGNFAQADSSVLMKVSREGSRSLRFSLMGLSGIATSQSLEVSGALGDKLIILSGFDTTRDQINDIALVDVSAKKYVWYIISNPLTAELREVRTFTLGESGEIPDWFLDRKKRVRFVSVRHRASEAGARLRTASSAGKQRSTAVVKSRRGFGKIQTNQVRLGYRRDWGIALQELEGSTLFVIREDESLLKVRVPKRRCNGVQFVSRILRRGDVSAVESCVDGSLNLANVSRASSKEEDRVLSTNPVGAYMYYIGRGDWAQFGNVGLSIPSIPTPGTGSIVAPSMTPTASAVPTLTPMPTRTPTVTPTPTQTPTSTITSTPTVTPTPTRTPMNTDVLQVPVSYSSFPFETDVTLDDFNGDGFLDIAAAAAEGRVDVLLGLGNGSFSPTISFLSPRAQYLDSGNLNGDGRVDLIVSDYINGALHTYLGNGDGTFTAAGVVDALSESQDVELVDLDRDGRMDAVVTSNPNNRLLTYRGNGDGTLTAWQSLTTGTSPGTVRVGDFNKDGWRDVVVGEIGSATVSLFINQGNGTLSAGSSYAAGVTPLLATVADWNRDSFLDLAAVNVNGGRVTLFPGQGNGTFGASTTLPTVGGPYGGAAGDFNGDGWQDLAVTSLANSLSIYLGNGDGTFQAIRSYVCPGAPRNVSAGDLNGDGRADLVVAQHDLGTIAVFLAK